MGSLSEGGYCLARSRGEGMIIASVTGQKRTDPVKLSGGKKDILEPMDSEEQLQELLDLAERLGIKVRYVSLGDGGGGICTIRGEQVLFVDNAADSLERVAQTAAALAERVDVSEVYVLPEVREALERYGGEG